MTEGKKTKWGGGKHTRDTRGHAETCRGLFATKFETRQWIKKGMLRT